MSAFLQSRLLVTGAGGHLGRHVVELLLDAGTRNLVAASRHPDQLAGLAARGAELRKVDFDDAAVLDEAFAGVERVLIISTDSIGIPGQRKRQHRAAVDAAVKAGVKHIAYTSMPSPDPGSPIPFAPDHFETEQVIERSGVGFTILRNNWYMENVYMWLPAALASGQWFTSAGEGRVGYVARKDAAAAAAAALTGAAESGRYNVSGPQALTTNEIAALVYEVIGKPIRVMPVGDESLADGLNAAGLPTPLVQLLVALDTNTRLGKVDIASDAVRSLTGVAPQSLRDFLSANRAALNPAG